LAIRFQRKPSQAAARTVDAAAHLRHRRPQAEEEHARKAGGVLTRGSIDVTPHARSGLLTGHIEDKAGPVRLTRSGLGLFCAIAYYMLGVGKLVVANGRNAFLGSNIGELAVTSVLPSNRSPLAFYLLALVMAVPIWAFSGFVGVIGSLKVPVTDLMLAFTPLTAALILVVRTEGTDGLISFLKRVFDYRSLVRNSWLIFAVLLAPLIYALAYVALHLSGHKGEPTVNLLGMPVLAAIMFVLAIGEEAGWTGYLLDPLQLRFGALGASVIIAVPWWLAHIPSIIAIGGTASDIAWWFPGSIALRVLMTSLYNNAGKSMLAVILFHAMLNVGRPVFYPSIGSHYDPTYQATGYGIAFVMSAIIVILWGPKSLAINTP
jgi:uncharacterized protein